MKRSNLIFVCLLAALYLAPLLVYGSYCMFPEKGALPSVYRQCSEIQIENPSLTSEQVKIFPKPLSDSQALTSRTYVYYQGKTKYASEIRIEGNALYIGAPLGADKDEKLTLHIRLDTLEKVRLNGRTIWPLSEKEEEF